MNDITPPNWPIYNVKLSVDEILKVIERVFLGVRLISLQDLSKRKSYNNRIYFLRLQHSQEGQNEDVVLKVIGRFFDGKKVQNEIASLLLVAHHCPGVPVPEVLAWSEDGRQINAIRNGMHAVLSDPVIGDLPPIETLHPWIMMSKCPGRVLCEDDMAGKHGESIAGQLADMVKSWREDIASREQIGNISLQSAGYTSRHALCGLDTIVSENLLTGTQSNSPLTTLQQYYDHLFADQLHKVNTHDIFTGLRPLATEQLQEFRLNTFPRLSCFTKSTLTKHEQGSIFTHQDLSPRNILISESKSGPVITGILDFEFSGFFPPEEEYLTCLGRQADDWPKPFMDLLLHKLHSKAVAIPDQYGDSSDFKTLLQVIKLIEHTAPWWLQEVTGKDLETKLNRARQVIEYNMTKLAASIDDT